MFILNFGRSYDKAFFEIFSKFKKNISLFTLTLFILAFAFLFKAPHISYDFVKTQISEPLKEMMNITAQQVKEIYKKAYLQGVRDALYIICSNNMQDCDGVDELYESIVNSVRIELNNHTSIDLKKTIEPFFERYTGLIYIILIAVYINVLDILLKIFVGLPISIILTFIKRFVEK